MCQRACVQTVLEYAFVGVCMLACVGACARPSVRACVRCEGVVCVPDCRVKVLATRKQTKIEYTAHIGMSA
jgi:hypothetical protein